MRQTLFLIPVAWVLAVWAIGCLIALFFLVRKNGWGNDVFSFLVFSSIAGAAIYFLSPYLQTTKINPANPAGPQLVGLPIQGYGFFLLLATVTGVGLAAWRAKRLGQNPENIFSLAFWMFILGIIGARAFYVIQKFDEMEIANLQDFVGQMLNMTKGGLVVYGGLIGALIAFVGFMKFKKLPMFEFGDIIAPSMIIGLSIGRLGCLMNGCCFGGTCTIEEIAVQFPQGSPPYYRQLQTGELLGVKGTRKSTEKVNGLNYFVAEQVEPGSFADKNGIKPGDEYLIEFRAENVDRAAYGLETAFVTIVTPTSMTGLPVPDLPKQSLKIHPTQIYSAINAALIFVFLWFFFPFRQQSGQVLALLLMIYPISRTILEFIRTDELGLWGTSFTISQWVSLFVFVLGLGLYVWVMLGKPGDGNPVDDRQVASVA